MRLTTNQTSYIQIHIAVLLFGFTAILGNLISLPAVVLVWWRVLITSISLLFFIQFGKNLSLISFDQIKRFALIGMIIGIHWICFYGSVKLSNASTCLICMSTASFFTSIIEPIILKTKFNKIELLIGLCIIPGMVLVVNNVDISYLNGIYLGLAAAILAALFTTLNKKNITAADPFTITFIELSSAWVMVTIMLGGMWLFGAPSEAYLPKDLMDWVYIIILALLCTTFAHVLSLKALNHLSTFATNLVVNLEPVYGILLAVLFLNEHKEMNNMFYLGAALILTVVLAYPIINHFSNKNKIIHAGLQS